MRTSPHRVLHWSLTALSIATLSACGGGDDPFFPPNVLPAGIHEISTTDYKATNVGTGSTAQSQDLLTAGLGKTGLGAALPPAYADPAKPTVAELRRNAIYSNYRGILDPSAAGGYGTL